VAKDKEVDDGASVRATLVGDMEEVVDAEIVRIEAETRSKTSGLRDGDSRGTDKKQEEVRFLRVFAMSCNTLMF
jgi:hypothetical protein